MPVVREAFPWLIILLLLSVLLWRQLVVKQASSPKAEKKNKRPWSLRPKTPKDCPGCAAQVHLRQVNPPPTEAPPPWEMMKGPGGRKKAPFSSEVCLPHRISRRETVMNGKQDG